MIQASAVRYKRHRTEKEQKNGMAFYSTHKVIPGCLKHNNIGGHCDFGLEKNILIKIKYKYNKFV